MKIKITEEVLNQVRGFVEIEKGFFSDNVRFSVKKNTDNDKWVLYLLDESDGSIFYLKELFDLRDFMNLYKAITNKDLKINLLDNDETHIYFQ